MASINTDLIYCGSRRWAWPDDTRLVMSGCSIWQHGDIGADKRGLIAAPHAADALYERVFKVSY